ncbi:hypothetical protein [Jiulongibacter sp. NS-SX5]|uniref:hypothetical protein n=1 Tax=Jiulongibacter sp. NS-SX5 TaxID=3463854 RepID=UPI004059D9D4
MKRFQWLLVFLPFLANAQIETLPANGFSPLRITSNDKSFGIGPSAYNLNFLNSSSSSTYNIGIGTAFFPLLLTSPVFYNDGKLTIRHNSNLENDTGENGPQLILDEYDANDYARLRFRNSWSTSSGYPISTSTYHRSPRFWDVAALSNGATASDDRLNFYNSDYGDILTIRGDGHVGVNATSPTGRMHVSHDGSDSSPHLNLINNATDGEARINFGSVENDRRWILQSDTDFSSADNDYFRLEYLGASSSVGSPLFYVKSNGNVGIGTTSPDNKLDVKGVLRAEEVIVETGWADYVFLPDYQLATLEEVEEFIDKEGHLANIPSAKDIQQNGAKVAELMTAMMSKIEELTLYTIQQQKEINELKSRKETSKR